MTRTNQSTTTSKVDVATLDDWNLIFNYSIPSGQSLPTSVNCTGNKQGQMVHLNANVSAQNESVNFSGIEYDETIAEAILTEMRTILNP